MDLTTEEHKNETTHCEQKPVTGWKEQIEKIRNNGSLQGIELIVRNFQIIFSPK